MLIFHSFKASGSTFSRLHQRLLKSFKEAAISLRHLEKSILDVIDAFNTTSRYLDDILNINNVYFENMVSQIYPSELQLNKANASDTEAAFLDLHLSISHLTKMIKYTNYLI